MLQVLSLNSIQKQNINKEKKERRHKKKEKEKAWEASYFRNEGI